MKKYKSKDEKIVKLRDFFKKERKENREPMSTATKIKIGILIAAGLVAISIPVKNEMAEHISENKIEERASIDTAFRDFKNLDKKEMGKYLTNQIKVLYEKYPDLNEMIFYEDEATKSTEFINDIYTLYKAYMVDQSDKEVEDINNVETVTVDRLVAQADRIMDGENKLQDTYREEYKHITDKFLNARDNTRDGAGLAKEMYELLALEIGLEKDTITSEEMAKEIEENNFYYDAVNKKFYTKEGPATLVSDQKLEKMQEKQTETEMER